MNRYLLIWVMLISLSTHAQTNKSEIAQVDTSGVEFIELLDSTAIGTPDGKSVSKEIGPGGGSIVSEDGRIEMIFPAGALTAKTAISIQPTTNPAPNGTGKAYWFEPHGIQFKKPVQFIFHYSDEEAEACPPDLMAIALQDKTGKWSFSEYEEWDSVGKILKGFIRHFSGATNVFMMWMAMTPRKVGVNDYVFIYFIDIAKKLDGDPNDIPFFSNKQKISWAVNGVKNGNSSVGTIINQTGIAITKDQIMVDVKYIAPPIMPRQNPVTITAEVYVGKGKHKERLRTFRKKLPVYDVYRVLVIHEYTGRAGMNSKLIDSASFVVFVYPDIFEIKNIRNYAPVVHQEGRNGIFKEKVFVDGALGTVHISGSIHSAKLSKDHPPEVYFEFSSTEILMCRIQHSAKGVTGEMAPLYYLSIPEEINFIANGQEQRYNMFTGTDNYKMIVRPLRRILAP